MDPAQPSPSADTPRAPGFTPEAFGRYYLVDRIAMGGMAEIFKAKTFGHGGFENVVVIKRILAHLSENPSFVKMFMDEAKITALLQHGNIVRIYDFGKIDRNYFIAMECVEGKDVKQVLRKLAERRKLIPREFAVYIAMEAAKGLDYAHKRTTLQGA
ncbi:MAG TPA: protein kinase, partial [Myxococcota bacterium]|nr:protein kinase [Myxococcota bacterium]